MSLDKTSLVQASEVGKAASGDQSVWNMGQDDSAINGKQLPPSPRRQCSTHSLPAPSTKPCKSLADMRNSLQEPPTQPLALEVGENTSPPVHLELSSDLKLSPESQVTEGCSGLRRKVISKETLKYYQERSQQGGSNRQPSLLIPWEKENKGNGEEEGMVQEKGLLEEIERRLSAALNSDL